MEVQNWQVGTLISGSANGHSRLNRPLDPEVVRVLSGCFHTPPRVTPVTSTERLGRGHGQGAAITTGSGSEGWGEVESRWSHPTNWIVPSVTLQSAPGGLPAHHPTSCSETGHRVSGLGTLPFSSILP